MGSGPFPCCSLMRFCFACRLLLLLLLGFLLFLAPGASGEWDLSGNRLNGISLCHSWFEGLCVCLELSPPLLVRKGLWGWG